MKNIIAFAGSNSSTSINKELVKYTVNKLEGFSIEILDLNEFEMPIYSADIEKQEGIPIQAKLFLAKMHDADGIICSLAEHNRTYTVAFKNILDWCSRIEINIFNKRPMLLMSTSPGGFGGGNVMALAKSFFPNAGANIIETFSFPKFYENFVNGEVVNEVLQNNLIAVLNSFEKEI